VSARRFVFVGVTTRDSSIMDIFPRWRHVLGLDAGVEMAGHDIPVGASQGRYREAVESLRADPRVLGALVTTHKIGIYEAAEDLFAELDDLARLCGEVSCIAKRHGALLGWAKDPIAAGRALERILGPAHFRDGGGHVLCMGAGGSGTAIALYLTARRRGGDNPARLIVTDRSSQRLSRLARVLERIETDSAVELVESSAAGRHDDLLAGLPPRSLVVNATGMGKDIAGSPLGPQARFPEEAIVWELNYRGQLDFLRHAREQAAERSLRVEDGWTYFIHGWTSVMEEVFERPISEDELDVLAAEAASTRPVQAKEER
jgi:shikimate 5-dehydrogenase